MIASLLHAYMEGVAQIDAQDTLVTASKKIITGDDTAIVSINCHC